MITWMQRHKKYLIITIWISTIAFVGAGFVGWGQYSYGDKAGAVAKVGSVEVTMGELQKSYSNLYANYNKMFQGNFDEEKAKSFGLRAQALRQLTDQALILNLAMSYDLEISDAELLAELKTQEFFFKDGVFNKDTYKEVINMNNMGITEYEADVKKQLIIQKVLKLLPVESNEQESNILNTIINIADKIEYKILDDSEITVDSSDEMLKAFWETRQQNFMTEVSYDLKTIKQARVSKTYEDAKINEHYGENRTHFKDAEGKILTLDAAKEAVVAELDAKATKDMALRAYIAYKKGKLSADIPVEEITIKASQNPYSVEVLEKISKLSPTSPYMKPVEVNGEYITVELVKTNPSKAKTFEEAKAEILPLFIEQTKKAKILKLAENSVKTFTGSKTDFITSLDVSELPGIDPIDAGNFLQQLFMQTDKRGFITLTNGKIILFNILEQKLLTKTNGQKDDTILKLKSAMFEKGLIQNLQSKYKTEIFLEGL